MKRIPAVMAVNGKGSPSLFVLLLLSLLYCAFSYISYTSTPHGTRGWELEVSVALAVYASLFAVLSFAHFRTFYLYSNAYLLCLVLFHFGITLQVALGLDVRGWGGGLFAQWLERGHWLTNLAIGGFGVGFSMSTMGTRTRYLEKSVADQKALENRAALYWSGVGLYVASAIFLIMTVAAYGNILDYARYEIFRSSADSRGWGLLTMVLPAAASLLLFGAYTKTKFLVAASLAVLVVLFFMFTGYRSAALFALLGGVITWVKIGRKTPLPIALGILFVAALSVSISGYLRNTGKYSEIKLEDVQKGYEQASLSEVGRLGQTVGIVAHTMKLVPHKYPYRMGGSYWRHLRESIPNIGLSIDEGQGRMAALRRLFSDPLAIYRLAPSDWITYEILREQYRLGQGVGYSGVAEPYLNFGVPGVFVIFALMGLLLGKFDGRNISINIYYLIFGAALFRLLLPTVRNDFSNFLKPTVFTLIILTIWWVSSRMVLRKKLPRPAK